MKIKTMALILGPFLLLNQAFGFDDLLEKGDAAYRRRGEVGRATEALENYRQAVARSPESAEANWRLSMACHFVGMRISSDDKKGELFTEGKEAGLRSIRLSPDCAPCHFWTAINQALYGDHVGAFKMLFSLKEIEEHLKQVIRIDPGYATGGAYRILGRIQEQLPGILGGSYDEARKYYRASIDVANDPLNTLFLARLLAKEFDDKAGALELIRGALAQPEPSSEFLESREARGDLIHLAEELEPSPSEG